MNKASLRKAFDRIKNDFDDPSSKGKLAKKAWLHSRHLFFCSIFFSLFFWKKTQKNNKPNIPSSQTGKDESAVTYEGAKKQKYRLQIIAQLMMPLPYR